MRWEEPHHPGPGLQLDGTVTHFPPLCNTTPQCKPICNPALGCPRERPADRDADTGTPGRRQRPARLPLPAAARQAPDLGPDRDRGRRDRRRLAVYVGPAIGAGAALAAFLLGLLAVFAIADSRAEQSFFEVYATQQRPGTGRPRRAAGSNPAAVQGQRPLRRAHSLRPLCRRRRGHPRPLHLRGGEHRRRRRPTDQLLPLHGRPGRGARVRRSGAPALLPAQVRPARTGEARGRLPLDPAGALESEALDERYEIFSGKEQDQVWLRRLFSPTFIVWLGEEAPKKFAFELVAGTLCCFVNGHRGAPLSST